MLKGSVVCLVPRHVTRVFNPESYTKLLQHVIHILNGCLYRSDIYFYYYNLTHIYCINKDICVPEFISLQYIQHTFYITQLQQQNHAVAAVASSVIERSCHHIMFVGHITPSIRPYDTLLTSLDSFLWATTHTDLISLHNQIRLTRYL